MLPLLLLDILIASLCFIVIVSDENKLIPLQGIKDEGNSLLLLFFNNKALLNEEYSEQVWKLLCSLNHMRN